MSVSVKVKDSVAPDAAPTAEKSGKRARRIAVAFAGLSALLLLPCFWQPRIEAGDLASHIYNAWLVQLIKEGKAPGLSIVHQQTNVLFDYPLSWLFARFGAPAAQRIAVSAVVLIFFWGAFSAVSALSRRRPVFVVPCLAILTYGAIFHLGSFNFYIALGLSFFALALLWRPNVWRWAASVPLLIVAWFGHPLPPLWVLAVFAYTFIARRLSPQLRLLQFLAAFLLLFGVREFVVYRFTALWSPNQLIYATGADQAILGFGRPYQALFLSLLAIWGMWLVLQLRSRRRRKLASSIELQLYALCVISAFLFPKHLLLSSYTLGDTPQRFSLIAGVLFCAVMSTVKPSRWLGAAFLTLAIVFFARLCIDAVQMNRLEAKVEGVVSRLPANARVFGKFYYPPRRGMDISMILDRACIGRCFSYGNYEPSMLQFRVRARPGNSIVAWNQQEPIAVQYSMTYQNHPLDEIYQCGRGLTDVCIRTISLSPKQ